MFSVLIYETIIKYGSKRALGFCCSRAHANDMAREFCNRGIPAVAVYSNSAGEFSEYRKAAIGKLKSGEIKVIFSVDMFNEGVDITSIDMVMFLRPTESPVVFLQQLGRGLRKSRGKEYLNVLDFIGNYEKAGCVRYLLTGNTNKKNVPYNPADHSDFPDDCMIDFDMKLIDLFTEMDSKGLKIKERINNEFLRVKDLLDKVPTRIDFFTYADDQIYELMIGHAKDNPLKNYLEYLKRYEFLSEDERILYHGIGREFINYIETTNMSKVYKMPVLMAFYNHGRIRKSVTEEQLLMSWKEFFEAGTNWKDLQDGMTYEKYKNISNKEHIKKIIQMPVKYLLKSGVGFFVQKEGTVLSLSDKLSKVIDNNAFIYHMKDAVEYRIMDYYQRRYRNSIVENEVGNDD